MSRCNKLSLSPTHLGQKGRRLRRDMNISCNHCIFTNTTRVFRAWLLMQLHLEALRNALYQFDVVLLDPDLK